MVANRFFWLVSHKTNVRFILVGPDGALDELDARGSIPADELKAELRALGRLNLEQEFGISWHRVDTIIRQSDKDRNGIIKYKEFLKTLSKYRLTSEQESKVIQQTHHCFTCPLQTV